MDGHQYTDYVVGHGALILGHGHPQVVEAVREQMTQGTHLGAGTPHEIAWAELVQRLIPSAELTKFTSSGTEATMMAMRLARAYTGKDKILKFAGHFHGWHDYAVAGQTAPWDVPASAGVPGETLSTMVIAPVNDLDFVDARLAEGDIAGVILEASGASWAAIPHPPGYLQRLREITTKHGVVMIMDEVITGFRYSPGGVQEVEGVTPDLTTLAKILAGGLPGGAVAGKADIMNLLTFRDDAHWNRYNKVGHPGTYNANPLCAVAGVTALTILSDPAQQQYADALAVRLRAGFNRVLLHEEVPGFCHGESSMFHLVLGTPTPVAPRTATCSSRRASRRKSSSAASHRSSIRPCIAAWSPVAWTSFTVAACCPSRTPRRTWTAPSRRSTPPSAAWWTKARSSRLPEFS